MNELGGKSPFDLFFNVGFLSVDGSDGDDRQKRRRQNDGGKKQQMEPGTEPARSFSETFDAPHRSIHAVLTDPIIIR
jgi:hypothetical protein